MGKGKGNSVWRSGHQKDKSRDGMSRHNQYTEAVRPWCSLVMAVLRFSSHNNLRSCSHLCDPKDCSLPGSSIRGILQERTLEWIPTSLLQGIFLTQGLNPGLLHCRQFVYHLSHQGRSSHTSAQEKFQILKMQPKQKRLKLFYI